jgi:enoyl-[acyl-carrier protein] reductase/trans-2-enoyl-CoA reductase (NAD+)
VERQINYIRQNATPKDAGLNALVVGASTGYGLASRIALTWAYGAKSIGVFFERPADGNRTAAAGYYNSVALHQFAQQDGLYAESINGDAFSDDVKRAVVDRAKRNLGQINLLVYSLAAPRRTNPRTATDHNSVLKPIGQPYTGKTIDIRNDALTSVTIEPATEKEIADTVAVMGGEDLEFWVDALLAEDLLAPECIVVAYSYIGPEITWPIYRSGTIGKAKEDLEQRIHGLDERLATRLGGRAYTSVNKAIISAASVAIPAVPLYISILNDVMDARGINEGAIGQMGRLFTQHLGPGLTPTLDDERRIRLDDREFRPDVAAEVLARWEKANADNFRELSDYEGFKRGFFNLFGFEVDGVDYNQPVETDVRLPE